MDKGGKGSAFDVLKAQHKDLRTRAQKLSKLLSQGSPPAKGTSKAGSTNTQRSNGTMHGAQGGSKSAQSFTQELSDLCKAWVQHSRIEENIVFPALQDAGVSGDLLQQAEVQRDLAVLLLDNMMARGENDALLKAEALAFCEIVPRLARFEEAKLFSAAKKAEIDVANLSQDIEQAQADAQDQAEESNEVPRPRHLRGVGGSQKEYVTMPMRGQDRDRDERGRFMDEDDHRSGGRSSSRSSGGHRGGSSRGSSRYDDDNDNRGWHGDSRGHSEASRRGWEERRGSSGRSRDDDEDDDRRSSSRGRSSGSSQGGRRTGGWFGDSEGHSEASRRGWDNSDHGESGWFGDREGHSQASRRGWDNPNHGDSGWFGDREGHSQASRRGWDNPNHGESGWFGDSEGHSEASRRGWRTRRDDDDDHDDRRRSRRSRD